jgi:hypothetical protein
MSAARSSFMQQSMCSEQGCGSRLLLLGSGQDVAGAEPRSALCDCSLSAHKQVWRCYTYLGLGGGEGGGEGLGGGLQHASSTTQPGYLGTGSLYRASHAALQPKPAIGLSHWLNQQQAAFNSLSLKVCQFEVCEFHTTGSNKRRHSSSMA